MIPLAKLKEDMQFAQDLNESIDLLKGVAVSQLQQFQNGQMRFDSYHEAMERCFQLVDLRAGAESRKSIYFNKDESLPRLIVGITSDEGFLGELNQVVIQAMNALARFDHEDEIVVLGAKGGQAFMDSFTEAKELPGVGEEVRRELAHQVRDYVVKRYSQRKVGEVILVYPYSKNIASQEIKQLTLLPLRPVSEMMPKPKKPFEIDQELVMEPSMNRVIQYLAMMWIGEKLWDSFWSAKISEQFARITHLDGSMEEIKQLNSKLKMQYFHHMHEMSDKSIREIFASRNLWK